MTVDLKPEQEQIIEQAITAGVIGTVDDVLELGVDALRQRLQSGRGASPLAAVSKEERMRRLDEFIQSRPAGGPLLTEEDISRETIYGTRGL